LRQALDRLRIDTRGQGFVDVTRALSDWVERQGIKDGLLTIWCRHTSASLLVQENADPDVRADLQAFFRRLAPEEAAYRHSEEGPDDMPAHIRAAVLPTQLSVPVEGGRLALGTWQAIYLVEHRRAPHKRELALHLLG
jgi:secondary thiamine-phosphate synthase enzyme